MLPHFGPLESLVADKLGGRYETGYPPCGSGSSAACHHCRGERARNVRLAPSHPEAARPKGGSLTSAFGGGAGPYGPRSRGVSEATRCYRSPCLRHPIPPLPEG